MRYGTVQCSHQPPGYCSAFCLSAFPRCNASFVIMGTKMQSRDSTVEAVYPHQVPVNRVNHQSCLRGESGGGLVLWPTEEDPPPMAPRSFLFSLSFATPCFLNHRCTHGMSEGNPTWPRSDSSFYHIYKIGMCRRKTHGVYLTAT